MVEVRAHKLRDQCRLVALWEQRAFWYYLVVGLVFKRAVKWLGGNLKGAGRLQLRPSGLWPVLWSTAKKAFSGQTPELRNLTLWSSSLLLSRWFALVSALVGNHG